jgi:hypothetical protein
MPKVHEPKRILSESAVARRLNVSRHSLGKVTSWKVVPDYVSSAGSSFFNPERLPEIEAAIVDNRLRRGRGL